MLSPKVSLNIAICDDDAIMLQKLDDLCHQILDHDYQIRIAVAQTPEELLHFKDIFQIALLDVELLESSGIDLARQILEWNPACRILFVSGFVHVVSDVYDVPHFCFILKDQLGEKLPKFLCHAAQMCAEEAGRILQIKTGKILQSVPIKEILYLERRGHYTYIALQDGSVLEAKEKLSVLHSSLGSADFVRCHISYLVNIRYARRMEGRTLILENGSQIPISLPHEQEVKTCFFRYISK